jgi:uncharacterized protein
VSTRTDPSRRETVLFAVATAVIVAHVLVDSFVVLEPGARRADHLAAGLVPFIVGGAAIWLYPRLRPGFRATVSIFFGSLALVGAGIALAHAVDRGPRGDDWTGLLLIPAGLALVALGISLLWRSRRSEGHRYLRRALILAAAAVAVYTVFLPLALALVVTHRPRVEVRPADLGRAYETVSLRTSDGLELAGWYVPSENGAAVIAYPGRRGPVPHARMLARHGYGVLLLDMRGQGESQGDPNSFGWGATKDIAAAIAFLRARPDVEDGRIGGMGLSVGGEQLLEAAATLESLEAVVSEGAGTRSVREDLSRGPAGWPSLPTALVLTAATAVLSGDAPPRSLEDLVARVSPTPIFLIYAGHGQGGEDLNPAYYRAAREPKTLWQIPEAGHTGGIEARPREYEERVVAFFDQALLES